MCRPRLLEHHAVLMLDGWVFKLAVRLAVARAIVLDLDDDAPQFASRKAQHILDDGCVPAATPDIPDQNCHPAAVVEGVVAALEANHEHLPESFVVFAGAEVA